MEKKSSCWDLFYTFAKVGAFTIGGGLAMLSLIRDVVIKQKKWLDDDEFLDVIALSQSLPGLLAVNLAIFIGYRANGTKGSIAATLGSVLPSFIMILIIAMAFAQFRYNPVVDAIFKGIRPVVVALIAVPTMQLAIRNTMNWVTGAMALATLILISFLNVSPIYILLTVGICAFAVAKHREPKNIGRNGDTEKDCKKEKEDKK